MMRQREPIILSDGLAPFGKMLPYPLTGLPNGPGTVVLLKRNGLDRTFNISLQEIEELYSLKCVLDEEQREERS